MTAADESDLPTLWFEVEDFLRHFDHFPNPIGIRRISLEIFSELEQRFGRGGRVRFCRLSLYTGEFEPVDFDEILEAYLNPPGAFAPWHAMPRRRERGAVAGILRAIGGLPRYLGRIARPLFSDLINIGRRKKQFERTIAPGDILVCLGVSWVNPRYSDAIVELKRRCGVRFVQLVHDVIPLARPDLTPFLARSYRRWFDRIIPSIDLIITISDYSRMDLMRFAKAFGVDLPPVEIITFGSGFREMKRAHAAPKAALTTPLPDRYVMCVSTIEERKNHRLLLRVWQRLIDKHGADAVPTLLFAGRPGYLIVDFVNLRAEFDACNYLDGKLVIRSDLSDDQLKAAYGASLFTVYPSFYEGWGLPVAESLAHGKFCISSNATSMPEVGGAFADYFDPADDDEAFAKIERALFEPGYLAAREQKLATEFSTPTWADCCRELVGIVDALSTQPQAAKTAAAAQAVAG